MTKKPQRIAITGPRKLSAADAERVELAIAELITPQTRLHVGCAAGVDAIARRYGRLAWGMAVHHVEGRGRYAYQKRSKAMIEACKESGTLHAWPNKACPVGLSVSSWKGSGTWGTMRYACHLGVPVVVHHELLPLNVELPSWLQAADQLLLC